VLAARRRAEDERLVVYVDENGLPCTRLGIRVAKRVGNSPQRNRIKRLIREAFRLGQHELPAGIDIVCMAKPVERAQLVDYDASLRSLVNVAIRKKRQAERRSE